MRTSSSSVALLCAGVLSTLPGALAIAGGLPDGTFANWDGCSQLERTPYAEIDAPNFNVLTKSALKGYEFACKFVDVSGRQGHWVATAFCEEAGVTYPDLIAIRRLVRSAYN